MSVRRSQCVLWLTDEHHRQGHHLRGLSLVEGAREDHHEAALPQTRLERVAFGGGAKGAHDSRCWFCVRGGTQNLECGTRQTLDDNVCLDEATRALLHDPEASVCFVDEELPMVGRRGEKEKRREAPKTERQTEHVKAEGRSTSGWAL